VRILSAESLRDRNTLALPATAEALAVVHGEEDLREAFAWAAARQLPILPLGAGSNVVLSGNLKALVVCLATTGKEIIRQGDESIVLGVAAGEAWHPLVEWCLEQGYFGLENLALIPGTVGAAPIQNIGAYGVELHSFVERVHALRIDTGQSLVLSAQECEFAYRDSVFKHRLRDTLVITRVELRLSRRPNVRADYPTLARSLDQSGIVAPTPADVFDAVVSIRSSRLPDPAREPNAGSFFKNPRLPIAVARELAGRFPGLPVYPHGSDEAKLPAGWLIEHCGWKGYRDGAVGVHPQHALVIVNYGGGDGNAVLMLAERIAHSVLEQFAVALEIEPRVYGT